jgi:hypothetical protein
MSTIFLNADEQGNWLQAYQMVNYVILTQTIINSILLEVVRSKPSKLRNDTYKYK